MGPRLSGPRPSRGFYPARTENMLFLPLAWTYEAGLPSEAMILGFWDRIIPIINGTGGDIVCSFSPNGGHRDQY